MNEEKIIKNIAKRIKYEGKAQMPRNPGKRKVEQEKKRKRNSHKKRIKIPSLTGPSKL